MRRLVGERLAGHLDVARRIAVAHFDGRLGVAAFDAAENLVEDLLLGLGNAQRVEAGAFHETVRHGVHPAFEQRREADRRHFGERAAPQFERMASAPFALCGCGFQLRHHRPVQPHVEHAAGVGDVLAGGDQRGIDDGRDGHAGFVGDAEQHGEVGRLDRSRGRHDHLAAALQARRGADGQQVPVHEVGLVGDAAAGWRHRIGVQPLPELVVRLARVQARLGQCGVAELRAVAVDEGDTRLGVAHFAVLGEDDLGVVDLQHEHRQRTCMWRIR